MISLEDKIIVTDGAVNCISKFEIMWRGPGGLYATLDQAVKFCKEHDFVPDLCIKPTVMAIDTNGNREEML